MKLFVLLQRIPGAEHLRKDWAKQYWSREEKKLVCGVKSAFQLAEEIWKSPESEED